jgi:hypothetical protein
MCLSRNVGPAPAQASTLLFSRYRTPKRVNFGRGQVVEVESLNGLPAMRGNKAHDTQAALLKNALGADAKLTLFYPHAADGVWN